MSTRFVKCEHGATAIEFALLAIPFIFLIIGIIEMAIMFAGASFLEGATNSAARLIRTGQLQQSGNDPEAVFRDALCDYAVALLRCDEIVVEAIPMESFTDFDSLEPEYDEDGNIVPQGFDAGGSEDRLLIRTSYRYHFMTPFIGTLLGGSTRSLLFMSTIVLQIEPYDFED